MWKSVRIAVRIVGICLALPLLVGVRLLIVHLLIVLGVFDGPLHNPYESAGICFSRDTPGATSRFVEYTFTSCAEPHSALADPVGTDLAVLAFRDIDDDGQAEAIVESSWYKCKFGGMGCFGADRFVFKICPGCEVQVRLASEERLPELERE